jgi:hypothetical protein
MISAKPRCEYFKCLSPSLPPSVYSLPFCTLAAAAAHTSIALVAYTAAVAAESPVALHVLIKESNILSYSSWHFVIFFWRKVVKMHKMCRWV